MTPSAAGPGRDKRPRALRIRLRWRCPDCGEPLDRPHPAAATLGTHLPGCRYEIGEVLRGWIPDE